MMILVVEDSPDVRQSLKGYFAGKPYDIVWVSSGRDALSALHSSQKFDLVILDMILEGTMSGWDVAYIKYCDLELAAIPLVFMTGMSSDAVHTGAHRHSASVTAAKVILSKPIDFLALERVLLAVAADIEPVTTVEGRKTLPEKKSG